MSLKKKIKIKNHNNKKNFDNWLKTINKSSIKLNNIKILSEINRSPKKFGIISIDTNYKVDGKNFNRVVQIEGDSVVIVPIIKRKKN